MADLGTRLVQAGLVTTELLANARARGHDSEGALVRALVARGLDEDAIAGFFVAAGFGPLMEAADLAAAPPEMRARWSAPMAHGLVAVPVRQSPAGLVVAMAAPSDVRSLAAIRRAVGGEVLATTARLGDLERALAAAYRLDEAERHDRSRRDATTLAADEAIVPLVRAKTPSARKPPGRTRVTTKSFEDRIEARPTPPPPTNSIIPPEHARWDLESEAARTPQPPNELDTRARRTLSPAGHAVRPAPLGGTLAVLRASDDRDEIVALACAAALTVSRAAVLFALRRGVLQGWDGSGAGLSRDALRALWIPTSSPSMFRGVVEHGEPYVGRVGATVADGLFRAAVGSRGGRVVIAPVLVAGKVASVLAADDVGFDRDGVERIESLARAVGDAFSRIVAAKRR